jgi:hypothetical protein
MTMVTGSLLERSVSLWRYRFKEKAWARPPVRPLPIDDAVAATDHGRRKLPG